MTSGKVVGSDFAVSRKHVYNFSLASLQFFTAEFANSSLDAGEFTNSSLVSLQSLRWWVYKFFASELKNSLLVSLQILAS